MRLVKQVMFIFLMALLLIGVSGCKADTIYIGNVANESSDVTQEFTGNIQLELSNVNQATIGELYIGSVQILVDGEYVAYDKAQIESISKDFVSSFSIDNMRGWDGKQYQYALIGHYNQDYTDQSILWRILGIKNGKALLLSEYVLDVQPFDYSSNEWKKSDIYDWLNSDFFEKAFSNEEMNAIIQGSEIGTVFLLSRFELTDTAYGFNKDYKSTDSNRRTKGTPWVFDRGSWEKGSYVNYYTRSQSGDEVDTVISNGKIEATRISREDIGIRPAIWVDLSKITFTSGQGTVIYPFQ